MGMGTANVANCEHARLVLGSGGGACQNAEVQGFRNGHPADARHYMLFVSNSLSFSINLLDAYQIARRAVCAEVRSRASE